MLKLRSIILPLFFLLTLLGCAKKESKRFRLVPSGESGINFRNTLEESVDFNIFNYLYFYNGGGVAVGDLNGDGLLDIYFTSNQNSDKLYLNKGGLKFIDITDSAGVTGFEGWKTGVTVADVNGDGKLDIYVSYLGDYRIYRGQNRLFINEGNGKNGVPHFSEQGEQYGLDLIGFSTQACFFDYDRDGDLDMFMLTHSVHDNGTYGKSSLRLKSHPLAGDRLLRNDNGNFVDVTASSGIYNSVLGYGLGVVASDVNLDGWMDIYVGNDFHENDYLYINQGDGTFKEAVDSCMQHTSRYTMGVDFADFNNDAYPDLIAMDMLPADPQILKSAMAEDPFDVYRFKIGFGYNHQFARNTLQINNHDGTFSEIGLMAGVASTDWSWATFFADFDLDGNKDIFVANGIERRSNDLDYINFIEVDSIQGKIGAKMTQRELQYIKKLPQIKIPNFLFINNGDSTFTNKANDWGMEQSSYSNGAAYADFDNDGDLDIVVNNLEDEAMLYENLTIAENQSANQKYIQVELQGKPGNGYGIGAKVYLYDSGKLQMQECMPTRGFQSSVDYRLTFGVGKSNEIDSLLVIWNSGQFQKITNIKTSQRLQLDERNASNTFRYGLANATPKLLMNVTASVTIPFKHKENDFLEFNREQLIPHMVSAEGPAASVGDVNGDGKEDIYIGGSKRQAGAVLLQADDGKFVRSSQPAIDADSVYEDVDASFFDVDGDSDQDLFVVSGGNEYTGKSQYMQPRIYLNDGSGNLSRSVHTPEVFLVGSCITVDDIDRDGDKDVFIGGRSIPWKYGMKADSYLLLNDGAGKFTDATMKLAPEFKQFGLVKHATWADIDGDKDNDLLIAAEWSPISIFINDAGKFRLMSVKGSGLEKSNGWWNFIACHDFDSDGDLDMIAGNLGLNSKLKASEEEPVRMYVGDFDKNDSSDVILSHFIDGKEYPFHTRDEMTKQMPFLKKRYLSYHKFAETTLAEMFSADDLEEAQLYEVYTFESTYIENLGNLKFQMKPLPGTVQFSVAQTSLIRDFTGDNILDVMLAGNYFPVNIQRGRYDASYGVMLQGDGEGNFGVVNPLESGFSVSGETRKLIEININGQVHYLAVRNNSTVAVFAEKAGK